MDEAKKWFNIAEEDLLWAKASLKEKIWRGACFAAQQGAEKSLKAYLLVKNKSFPKIHDLVSLNDHCRNIDNEFDQLNNSCNFISPYYLSSRYPDIAEFEEYSQEMAIEVVQKAEEIIKFVESRLN